MNPLARKAYDVTEASALSAESPKRWASIFAHVYCRLLARADDAAIAAETELIGVPADDLRDLARHADGSEAPRLAVTVRALGSRRQTPLHDAPWFATIERALALGQHDDTVHER